MSRHESSQRSPAVAYHGCRHKLRAISTRSKKLLWTTDNAADHWFARSNKYAVLYRLEIGRVAIDHTAYLVDIISEQFLTDFERWMSSKRISHEWRDSIVESLACGLDSLLNGCGSASLKSDFWGIGSTHLHRFIGSLGYAAVRLERGHPWMCVLNPIGTRIVGVEPWPSTADSNQTYPVCPAKVGG